MTNEEKLEMRRKACQRYYDRHRAEILERAKQQRQTPEAKAKALEKSKKFAQANPEKIRLYKQIGRARRLELGITSNNLSHSITRRRRLERLKSLVPNDRNGARWTLAEDRILLQDGMNNCERAFILHRSYSAVVNRRLRVRKQISA